MHTSFTDSDVLGRFTGSAVTPDTRQRLAVSSLVAWNEKLAESGALVPSDEEALRKLIAETLSAFQMPTRAERNTEAGMRAKYVNIQVSSGRGVADRYRRQYPAETTDRPGGKDPEDTYQRLAALGDNPPIDKVAEIIGNKSWSYITCDGCGEYVERAVSIGEYDTKAYCETCMKEAHAILVGEA